MRKFPTSARVMNAALLIATAIALAGCASPSSLRTDAPRDAAHTSQADIDHSGDGPPQRSERLAKLAASQGDAKPRVPLSRGIPPGPAFPAALPDLQSARDQMVAHFIDVGQGDAVLLEFSCAAVLIDTGGESTKEVNGRKRLSDYLRNFFLRRSDLGNTLKLVVLSHPHKDHTDGVFALLELQPQVTIENIVDNGAINTGSGITGQRRLQRYADEAQAGYEGIAESDITSASGMTSSVVDPVDCRPGGGVDPKITTLWGRVDLDVGWANDGNNDSVVLRVDFGDASFLFTGDLEKEGIEAMLTSYDVDRRAFNVDVLKVGHHGSHNATTSSLIAATTPKIAVIQAGNSNLSRHKFSAYTFAHPHQNSIDMLLDGHSGVSMTRPPKDVPVGIKGKHPVTNAPPEFTTVSIKRAIYTTGWDGNIAVIAKKDGTLRVESGF